VTVITDLARDIVATWSRSLERRDALGRPANHLVRNVSRFAAGGYQLRAREQTPFEDACGQADRDRRRDGAD
jgi:hypothetical protein